MKTITTIADVKLGLKHLASHHEELARALEIVRGAGLEVPLRLRPGGFGGLAEIIIAQLVSKASASAISKRFIEHISPLTPATYMKAGEETWRTIGLSRPKQKALAALSTALISGQLNLDTIGEKPVDEAIAQLCAVKGIGPWSAEVYLLFCVGHADIFPSGDLALREAARQIFSMNERPTDKELAIIAQSWSPWRGVAARLLWTLYAAGKGGKSAAP